MGYWWFTGNVTSLSYTPDPARTARGDYWLRIYDADDPSNNSKWFDSNTFGIDVNRAPSAIFKQNYC